MTSIDLQSIITPKSILFFDMDDTLIETTYLNNYAYCEAIRLILGYNVPKTYAIRLTRQVLQKIPGISPITFNAIVDEKKRLYSNNLFLAQPIIRIVGLLKDYCSNHKTYLTTRGCKDRVIETINYFGLFEYFNDIISCDSENKYKHAIDVLDVNPTDIVVFEDDDKEIENCIKVGILSKNIIKVSK